MNENTKTLTIVGVAVVAVLLAALTRLGGAANTVADASSTVFYPDFTDPLAAKSLEIIEWDKEKAEPKQFRVAQVNGRWAIPSKFNYPADAERHLAEAAGSLMDLEKIQLVSNLRADHGEYEVVDPSDSKPGAEGIGKKVIIEDGGGKKLAAFIIGKEVKDKPELRYIRLPTQDAVYITKLNTDKLTTNFSDWIEPDLMKLNSWDITEVQYDNYSIDEVNRRIVPGERIKLDFNDKDSKWTLAEMLVPVPDSQEMKSEPLTDTEELNTQKLNDMKTALDELKIVDVRRKPAGLGRDLRTAEGMQIDDETFMSLASKGFIISQNQLFSNEGEVIVRLKDGVYYVLRFGEIAADTEQEKPADKPADGQPPLDEKPQGQNRYLFITADFNPEAIPKPELQTVPGAPAEPPAAPGTEAAAQQPPAADPNDPAAVERQKIEQANKLKQDEYDAKIKAGEEQKTKLNDRFADWYYVISDETYRKIKLNRADFVQVKKPAGEEAGEHGDHAHEHDAPPTGGLDEFNEIQKEGLPAATP